MRKRFRTVEGKYVDEVPYILKVLSKNPGAKVYVGSDSQKRRKTIEYAVVIAIRYGTKGCHIIYNRWNVSRRGYGKGNALIEKRLTEEIHKSIETASYLRENSIFVYQVDFDINSDTKWFSNKYVQMAMGWAKGLGFNVSVKPDEQVAVKAANHIVNH